MNGAKKVPVKKSLVPYCFLPYFCQKFSHASAKKKQRVILDFIFCISGRFSIGGYNTLALAHPYFALCVYVFCTGHGHCLKAQ